MSNNPFIVHDDIASFIEKNVSSYVFTPYVQNIIRTISPYELTECDRKIYYRISKKRYRI
jgi:hypothetical protein